MKETRKHVLEVVAKRTKVPLSETTSLDSLDLDSLDKLDIATELMNDYNIDIEPRELDKPITIEELSLLVTKKKDEALQLAVFGSDRNCD